MDPFAGFWGPDEEPSNDPIFSLIKENKIEEVRQLINADEGGRYMFNVFNYEGDSPLLLASFLGRFEIVKIIIEHYQPEWWDNDFVGRESHSDALRNATDNPGYTAREIINILKIIIYLAEDVAIRGPPGLNILTKVNPFDGRTPLELIQTELFFRTNYAQQARAIYTLEDIKTAYKKFVKNEFKLVVNRIRQKIRECKNNAVTVEKIARNLNLSRPIPNNVVSNISRLAVNNKFGKSINHLKRLLQYVSQF